MSTEEFVRCKSCKEECSVMDAVKDETGLTLKDRSVPGDVLIWCSDCLRFLEADEFEFCSEDDLPR